MHVKKSSPRKPRRNGRSDAALAPASASTNDLHGTRTIAVMRTGPERRVRLASSAGGEAWRLTTEVLDGGAWRVDPGAPPTLPPSALAGLAEVLCGACRDHGMHVPRLDLGHLAERYEADVDRHAAGADPARRDESAPGQRRDFHVAHVLRALADAVEACDDEALAELAKVAQVQWQRRHPASVRASGTGLARGKKRPPVAREHLLRAATSLLEVYASDPAARARFDDVYAMIADALESELHLVFPDSVPASGSGVERAAREELVRKLRTMSTLDPKAVVRAALRAYAVLDETQIDNFFPHGKGSAGES